MELTKRTKLAGAALLVAVAALAVDRLSGGPASAQAAPEAPAPAPKPVQPPPVPEAADPGALADRMSQLRPPDQGPVPNAFAAPPDWFPAPIVKKAAAEPEKPALSRDAYQLKAVMKVGDRLFVLIDGHALSVGEQYDVKNADGTTTTIKLVNAERSATNPGSATIDVNGRTVELKLDPRTPGSLRLSDDQRPRSPARNDQ